ncbi:MAG: hypothetical protein U1F27_15895 [Turneriella sp.]
MRYFTLHELSARCLPAIGQRRSLTARNRAMFRSSILLADPTSFIRAGFFHHATSSFWLALSLSAAQSCLVTYTSLQMLPLCVLRVDPSRRCLYGAIL